MSASRRRGAAIRLRPRRWSPTSGLSVIAAAALLVLLVASPALAHAELASSVPEDNAVLETPPTVITLTFSEALDQAKSSFKLDGPAGTVGTGKPDGQGGTVMTLHGLTLEPGVYGIAWTAAATDGHVERGKLSFTVSQPKADPATPSPTLAATGAPTARASAAPVTGAPLTGAPAATPPDGGDPAPASGSGTDVLFPIVVGLVLVGGLGGLLLRRSRRA